MDVINLCDSDDDDETDTQEPQNHQRLERNHQSFRAPQAANATTSRSTATQRPRSVSSVSNSNPVQTNDDIVCLSDDDENENDDDEKKRQEQFINSRAQQKRTTMKNSGPMSARQKSWTVFQQMRIGALQKTTETPSATAASKKTPPAQQIQDKRKRKRSNSSADHRKKSAGSAAMAKKSTAAGTNAKKNDNNMASRQKSSFLEQGLGENIGNNSNHNSQSTDQAATNPLDLLASLELEQLYDYEEEEEEEILTNDKHQQEAVAAAVAALEEIGKPRASSSGATLQAAIEIDDDDSDDDDDDDDDIVEVQPPVNGNAQNDANEQGLGQTQQPQAPAGSEARATENFHPLLQLDASAQPAEHQQNSSSAEDSRTSPNEESESVVHILDHRFSGGKVTFEVRDFYGNLHRGIELDDLKVDAPALLSNYILKKARGKLSGKVYRQWAQKTKKKLDKKAKLNMARQKRWSRENGGSPGARAVPNQPTHSTAQTSHVPIGLDADDDDEGELEFEFEPSPTSAGGQSPNLPPVPDSETRDSATQIDAQLDEQNKENDHSKEASMSDADIATETEIQVDHAQVQARSSSNPVDERDDEAIAEMTKNQQPLEASLENMSSVNESEDPAIIENSHDGNSSEDPANIENSNDELQETGQRGNSDSTQVPLQMDAAAIPELNEEVLAEPREDTTNEPEPRTPEGTTVGLRPAYSVADVAMEILEEEEDDDDDDDEIEVVIVKPPTRRDYQDDDSSDDDSVQSVTPPSSNSATRQPLVGSIETPIDVDDEDDKAMASDRMGRSFPTMGGKTSEPAPPPTGYSYFERRFVFHQTQPNTRRPPPSVRRPTANTWSYGWSCDAAMREQERLFQASAAKMKSQATARVTTSVTMARNKQTTIKFQQVVPNIAEKYPLHWQFPDYSARLGVPEGSSEAVLKKQYRRLALIYHPDKSQLPNTATKFQNITEAYRALLNG